MSIDFVNFDANEGVFLNRQLEAVKAKTYDKKYGELKAVMNIPVSTEAGNAAETIVYDQYDMVGMAKMLANYADDAPRVDVKCKRFSSTVKGLAAAYGFSIQELRAAARENKDLATRKPAAARRAIEQKINALAWLARPTDGENAGLTGLVYQPNVTKGTVTTRGGHVTFATKTGEEMYADLCKANDDILTLTNGTEIPDTLLLPMAQHGLITSTFRTTTSDTTVLEAFLKARPNITKVDWVAELAGVNPVPSTGAAASTDVMICYKRSPDYLTLEIPQPFEQLETERRGLEYTTTCHARTAGVIVYYPLSINIVEGI